MPNRSRMAVIAVAIATISASAVVARAGDPPVANRVNLQLQILGLGQDGCEVEVRPAHAECKFDSVVKKIDRGAGSAKLDLPFTVESSHADRDCSFKIIVKEPGRPIRTFHRGVRLTTPVAGQPVPVQTCKYTVSTASLAAREEMSKTRR